MADFSPSGVYGMPPVTADLLRGVDSLQGSLGDPRVLGWLREAVIEGDRINQSDPSYEMASLGMQYVVGQQIRDPARIAIRYLPQMTINESRKVTQAHASVLTDLKPVWGYKSQNPQLQQPADLLNHVIIAWYLNQQVDTELAHAVKLSLAAGTADVLLDWDPTARFGGDHRVFARDFRDTLPWRPSPMSRDVQDWQGCCFREEHSINVLRGKYPTRANLFIPTPDSLLSTLMGRFRQLASRVITPVADTFSGLTGTQTALQRPKSGNCLFYRFFLKDETRNLTLKPIPMGPPGASWAYVVKPGEKLYPYNRLILATPEAMIWDGPAPFWHAQFPVSRLMLWTVPWQMLGVPLLNDLIPVQDGINDTANDIRLAIKQWMDRTTVYDRQAVSETFMRLFDPRRPGSKVKTNPTYGDGFKMLDGPNPQVIALALEFLGKMIEKFNDLSGVANLQQLLQLRQMPGADTIRQYYEAQTPELRAEGRQMEMFLRPLAEQLKVSTFQYRSKAYRQTLLGDAGLALEDFDFDPDTLVPAMEEGQPGYTPELDKRRPRWERAQFVHQFITFMVNPNSILAMNSSEQKMIRLQLSRQGYYDFWSLLEALEIPNVGTPPAIPLPPLRPPDPMQVMSSMAQGDGRFIMGPMGQILEVRVPTTVTERLIAQAQLGIGMTENPAGRKASGETAPHMESGKTDDTGAPRQAISESSKGSGPKGGEPPRRPQGAGG